MTRILILTKNPLAEQGLQSSLQRLNSEVYCSACLLQSADSCSEIIQHFSIAILSDTISNHELSKYLPAFNKHGLTTIRVGDKKQLHRTEFSWLLGEVDEWIDRNPNIPDLIDKVAQIESEKIKKESVIPFERVATTQEANHIQNMYHRFISDLSTREKDYLYQLYKKSAGSAASRKEICDTLWGQNMRDSNLAQLSSITNRVKRKLRDAGFDTEEVRTVWGKGYVLGSTLRNCLKNNNFSVSERKVE